MSFLHKNTKIQILLFSLACTIVIFNLNKKSNLSSFSLKKLPFSLRNLIENEQVKERCSKTTKDFLKKYNETDKIQDSGNTTLDNYQKALKEMIESKKIKFDDIKKYWKRLLIYLIFLIVDLIIIILWFVLCGQCCCGKKYKDQKTCCSKFIFSLFFFFNVIAILICAYGFIISPCFYKSINGVVCSLYKLVFHFIEGANNDYHDNYWKGIEGLNYLLREYNGNFSNINDLPRLTCNNEECFSYNNNVEKLKSQTNEFKRALENSTEIIESVSEPINNIKNETLDDIEKIMEKFDKYGKLGLYGLFGIIALFCLLSLITLTAYFICGCSCISCLFHLIWNIQMIIIIVIILVGICFGSFGIISKDFVEILKNYKNEQELFSEKFLNLTFNEEYINQTYECLNKDGNLYSFVFKENSKDFSEEIKNLYDEFNNDYNKFKRENIENIGQSSDLDKAYENLNQTFDDLLKLNDELNIKELDKFFNCSFFNNDFNILLSEIKDILAKKLSFMSLVVIVPVLVTFLAVVIGVLLVSNYASEF